MLTSMMSYRQNYSEFSQQNVQGNVTLLLNAHVQRTRMTHGMKAVRMPNTAVQVSCETDTGKASRN